VRIFLTGATGFVGQHLIRAFESEHELFVTSRRPTGRANEIVADLLELQQRKLPENIDVVIHAAAFIGGAGADPNEVSRTNIDGTIHVARAAAEMKAKRFVLLSTGGVYGPAESPRTEESAVAPLGDYAVSKWSSEMAARALQDQMRVQILRLFFPYGPGQREDRLVPRLIRRIRNGEPITAANGNGPQLNPIYIDDLIESMRRLMTIDQDLVVNLAGTETVTVRNIAEEIGRIVGTTPNIVSMPETPASWVADITRAIELTGYTPRVSLAEGLRRTSETML
jgi:nucleoside-diphosphate-sugar epimerase